MEWAEKVSWGGRKRLLMPDPMTQAECLVTERVKSRSQQSIPALLMIQEKLIHSVSSRKETRTRMVMGICPGARFVESPEGPAALVMLLLVLKLEVLSP